MMLLAVIILVLSHSDAQFDQQSRLPESTERDPVHAWRFQESSFTGGVIPDTQGAMNLRLEKGGLRFTGEGPAEAVLLHEDARPLDLVRDVDPATLLPSDAFSIASWIRIDKPISWAAVFSAITDDDTFERGWASGCNGDRFYLGVVGEDGDDRITYLFSDVRATPGRWHHLVATYDGNRMKIYIDGELDVESSRESGKILWPDTTTIALGSYVDSNERHHLHGALHSVFLYDIALDEHEIAELHTRDADTFPQLEQPEDRIASIPATPITAWPTYRRDPQRSGATPEPLSRSLIESWVHQAPAVPRPSWPEPARSSFWQEIPEIVPRVVFDECFQPVSNGEVVLYGSSSDDHVRCIDIDTGRIRWTHATNGPIRFAPIIDGSGAIVTSDDGTIRRLDLADGSVDWIRQLAPSDRRVVGNGRLISAWPIRTGPVLDRGLVSVTVGLFPRFGTWATTLNARTGEPLWRTELPGISPQGYLLASPRRLFIPTGRTSPVMLGRIDGRSVGRFEGPGGAFALLLEDELLTGPGSRGRLELSSNTSKEIIAAFDANHAIVVEDLIVLAQDKTLSAIDRTCLLGVLAEQKKLERLHADLLARREQGASISEELEATAIRLGELQQELLACELWRRDFEASSLALAGDTLVVGGRDEIVLFDERTGEERGRFGANGRVLGLAIAQGRILAATDRGTIHCLGPERADEIPDGDTTELPTLEPRLAEMIRAAGMDRGLAIIVGAVDAEQGLALANELRLHVIIVEPDESRAAERRMEIRDANFYGDQLVVLQADPVALGIERIANVLIDEGQVPNRDPVELARLVRPSGGLFFPNPGESSPSELDGFTNFDGDGPRAFLRSTLEGAGDWTHPYADAANTTSSNDAILGGEYGLRWFGGPGPQRMVDRHLRTTASLAMGGRLFIPGNDIVIGIDAYNGMELWSAPLPGFTRTGAPYDGGWWAVGPTGVFAAVGDEARVIDPRDGAIVDTFKVPPRASASCGAIGDPSPRCEWSWLALEGTQLLGSAALPGTSHLDQSRASIVDQYSDSQPLATSRALFSIDLPTRRTNWVHGDGLIVNPTISVRDGRIVFVESRSEPALADLDGRVTLKDLRRGPLDLVAIDSRTGRRLWRVPLDGTRFDHSLFVALAPEQVILTGSSNGEQSVQYHVAAHDPVTGKELWRAQHPNDREGINGSHGEQVHHPVLLDGVLIAEPHAYELATGKLIDPTNSDGFYLRSRSGCGTISASRNCLFYRDKNPTVLDLTSGTTQQNKLTHASRPGCWVNVIPAQGMALIPESSSGCVCGYSLQTSLGLFPLDSRD